VRIASYNVHNLLDEDGARLAGAAVKTPPQMKALIGTLAELRADVVLLQEVGDGGVLDALNDQLPAPYPYLGVLPGNSLRGIHLAILSREPFELTSHRDAVLAGEDGEALSEYETEADAAAGCANPVRFQRDIMLAELLLEDGEPLALFNVHLKSKTNRPWKRLAADVIRAAEVRHVASTVRAYLDAHPGRGLVLAGDFNDTRSSDVLKPLFALPLSDPMGEALARSGRNPSTYWPKRRMRFDFVLLSPALRARMAAGSARIHSGQRAQRASDHYPVSVDLML
jgi:endonuclease/exonuclease/phosphatase family metal-dependent hydrolase